MGAIVCIGSSLLFVFIVRVTSAVSQNI